MAVTRKMCPVCEERGNKRSSYPLDRKFKSNWLDHIHEAHDLKCEHDDVEIERACCSGIDSEGNPSCGCHGQDSVYCPDCDNEDMTDSDIEAILTPDEPDYEPYN